MKGAVMEASDAFGTPVSEGEDPFAGGEDWAGFGADDEPAATEQIKTVDREGQEVKPEAAATSDARSELERQEDAYQYKVERGEPVSDELVAAHEQFERQKAQATQDEEFEAAAPQAQTDAIVAEDTTLPQSDTERAAEVAPDPNDSLRAISEREEAAKAAEVNEQQAATDAQEAAGAAERAVEEVQAAEAERETAESPEEVAAPSEVRISDQTPAEPETPGGEIGTEEANPPAPEPVSAETPGVREPEPEAEAPEERESPGGKKTHRRYYVLRLTDPGKFEQVTWFEKDGKMVAQGTAGAKRQSVAVCRGTEDALRIGHRAVGSPDTPVKLVAVAALHFQPKTLEPDVEPQPKLRLKIS